MTLKVHFELFTTSFYNQPFESERKAKSSEYLNEKPCLASSFVNSRPSWTN